MSENIVIDGRTKPIEVFETLSDLLSEIYSSPESHWARTFAQEVEEQLFAQRNRGGQTYNKYITAAKVGDKYYLHKCLGKRWPTAGWVYKLRELE